MGGRAPDFTPAAHFAARCLFPILRCLAPPGLWIGPQNRRWVTLTIDDGPHERLTPWMLETLARAAVPATFFLIGHRADQLPELTRAIHEGGHTVGNHTWNHRPFAAGVGGVLDQEVTRTETLLTRLCPGSLRVFRPPYGWIGPGGRRVLERAGMMPVYWSILPRDWEPLPAEVIRNRVRADLHPGGVIVLHGGTEQHRGAAEALPDLIADVRAEGYEIVPLVQMLDAAGFAAGYREVPDGDTAR